MIRRVNFALLWGASLGVALIFARFATQGLAGTDSHAYWLALQSVDMYGGSPTDRDAYLYSPLFGQVLAPLGWLTWPAFQLAWFAAGAVAAVWLVKPLPVRWAVPLGLLAVTDLVIGNVYVFLGVMLALGARHSSAWLFGVLTKVTPGIGLLWLVARGEYRAVAQAGLLLGALVWVSAAAYPAAWTDWLRLLTSGDGGDPTLIPRCVAAVVLVLWGARRHPAWLAVAVVLATPVLNAAACFVPLLAIPRLVESTRRTADVEAAPDMTKAPATREG